MHDVCFTFPGCSDTHRMPSMTRLSLQQHETWLSDPQDFQNPETGKLFEHTQWVSMCAPGCGCNHRAKDFLYLTNEIPNGES